MPASTNKDQRITSTDYGHPHRPLPVALFNRAVAPVTERLAARLLDGARLLAAARRATGLTSLAASDEDEARLLGALDQLLRSLRAEARLSPTGLLMVRENLLRLLKNRLRLRDAFVNTPELRASPARPPLFIVGLQRTGTTLLHRLLGQDQGLRGLRSWEAINPAPIPRRALPLLGKLADRPGDPRIRAAELAERGLRYLAPDFFAVHPVEAHALEEDCLLLDYTFHSTVFEATLRVPSFSAWLEQQDHRWAYGFYAKILSYLQDQRGAGLPWLLKTPHHMEQLDVLLETFPEAMVIQPHRDPQTVLASFCSMVAHGRGVFSDHVDAAEIGAHWTAKLRRMVDRCLEVREQRELDERFIDVPYAELVADPLAVARRIYRAIGRDLEPATEARMRAFLPRAPQHKHGRHRYQLTDFGLEPQAVARAFTPYRDRFDVAAE